MLKFDVLTMNNWSKLHCRIFSFVYTALYEVAGSGITLGTIYKLPCYYSTSFIFRLIFIMKLFTIFIAGNINAAFDTLLPGLML